MTEAPDWALAVPAVGVHNAPPRVPGPDLLQITWQQMQQVISGLVNEFLRQVAVALGAIEIFGFKPYQALVEIGEKIEAGVDNFNLLLTAFGLPTIGDVADLLANQANDFANFLAATGQATFAALGAALQALIDFLTAIPANLLSGALPTNVTLSGTQLGTLLQYLNSSGQYAAAQLTGAINTGLTFSGTALSTLLQYLNGSGQFSAAQLTGGINTAVTFGGTQLGTLLQYLNSSGQFAAGQLTGAINGGLTLGGVTLSTLVTNINSSGQILAAGITGALGTGLTVGGVTLGTLFTNINSSGQLVLSGATGALNTAVTIGGTALSTLSTNWNAAVTNINNLIGGVTGASTITDVANNLNLAATNIAQIGTAAQNAAAGIVGSFNTAANQVQTAFAGILGGIFGGAIGAPSVPTPPTQAQATSALQAVNANVVGNAAAIMALQIQAANAAALMSVQYNFGDYANGSLPAAFTITDDLVLQTAATAATGGLTINGGRVQYSQSGSGLGSKKARYNVAATSTDYQQISFVCTSVNGGFGGGLAYLRMNSAADSYVGVLITSTVMFFYAVVSGVRHPIGSPVFELKYGCRYTIKAGALGSLKNFYVYENETLLATVTDNTWHQTGSSYRYAGFGIFDNNTGTVQSLAFNSFGIADQVFLPGPPTAGYTSTSQSTNSTSYADLSTVTSTSATIGSSGMALVVISANHTATNGYVANMGYAVSGATTVAASDSKSMNYWAPAAGATSNLNGTFLETGLNPGSNTFTLKHKSSNTLGNQAFAERRISVIPL